MIKTNIFNKTIEKTVTLQYAVYTPDDYDGTRAYPLIVMLHGAGERGTDPSLLWRHGLLKNVKEGKRYPAIIVAPQVPDTSKYWANYNESLNVFLDGIIESYNVDTSRIYLTGLSMGGTGTWHWLLANPERFAAAAPICGTGVYWNAHMVANIPLWVFHGDKDAVVPVEESINMVNAIKNRGGDPKLTIYEGVGHNSWELAYNDELVEWLLSHKKEQ